MIVTARQLEDLHRQNGSNGHVTLPYRARLTPLAADWIRLKKIALGYGDIAKPANGNGHGHGEANAAVAAPKADGACCTGCAHDAATGAAPTACCGTGSTGTGGFLWWCDGPCGPAKAALLAQEKESTLTALDVPADAKRLVQVLKAMAAEVKSGRAAGGVLMVQNAALAAVYANRCPSLRAVVGTCQDAVEQGVKQVAANVLVIEYPQKTLQQMRNMLGRFVKANRTLSDDVKRQLQDLATCG